MKLEIGTEICLQTKSYMSIETIVRETKTLWITENGTTRINKKTQKVIGDSMYGAVSLSVVTEKNKNIKEKFDLERVIQNKLSLLNLRVLDIESLRKLNDCIISIS